MEVEIFVGFTCAYMSVCLYVYVSIYSLMGPVYQAILLSDKKASLDTPTATIKFLVNSLAQKGKLFINAVILILDIF